MAEVNHTEILENMMHELARINSIIKASSEAISKGVKKGFDKSAVVHHSEIILENSFLFSTHLDIVNYQLNPDFFEIEAPDKRNIYGKFHKAILSYRRVAKQKEIEISVRGTANSLIDSYPVIDTLPILIIDNAIKYTPRNSEVEIDFLEDSNEIEVTVANMGPFIKPDERGKIFTRGYRGEEAIKTNASGLGFGLSFIKHICDIHQADINIEYGQVV